MIKLDKLLIIIDALEVGDNMMSLYRKVGLQIKNYSYMIKGVKFLEKKKVIILELKGNRKIVTQIFKNKINTFDKILKLVNTKNGFD